MEQMPEFIPVPAAVDVQTPSPARMYDYYLGGACNFDADRRLAAQVMAAVPEVPELARANKAFLRRAVQYCVAQGVRQFCDIGCGITGSGATHQVAQRTAPGSRVVYVDNEAVAVEHNKLLLADNDNATILQADAREPERILSDERLRALIDVRQPVAVMFGLVLPWVSDEERPAELIARCADALPAGSYLIVSHATIDNVPDDVASRMIDLYQRSTTPVTFRPHAEMTSWFDRPNLSLVEPGVSFVALWRPEEPEDVGEHPERSMLYGAVAAVDDGSAQS